MPNPLPSILNNLALTNPPPTFPAPQPLINALSTNNPSIAADTHPIFFEGLPHEGCATRVFAYLGMPSVPTDTPSPGIVLVHGGGGTAYADWVRLWNARGYAAIAMDLDGCVPVGEYNRWAQHEWAGPSGITFPGTGAFVGIDKPIADQWHAHALAAIVRAHSLLAAQPGVDSERIGMTGISFGGYLACLVAGFDTRLKFVAPVYGGGFIDECPFFAAELDRLDPAQRHRWLELWDPRHTLPDATMPIHWVTGTNDFAYPLPAVRDSMRFVNSPASWSGKLRMSHGHDGPGETPPELRIFADSVVRGGVPLPSIERISREGDVASATFAGSSIVKRAELLFTRSADPDWQMRDWTSTAAEIDATTGIVAASLPGDVTAWFINLVDSRDCIASSELQC